MANELIERDETHMYAPPTRVEQQDISGLMALAVQGGMDPAGLEKLFALYERDQAIKAQRAFAEAMANLQAEAPVVSKNRTVQTGKYSYNYAEFDHIATVMRPLLHKHGLSYRFDSQIGDGMMAVKCIVTHSGGHSESTKFACPIGGLAGGNDAQQTASALSYARRYALLLAFGLSTGDVDDDGQGGVITPEQVGEIVTLLKQTAVDKAKFLDWLGVEAVEDIPVKKFGQAMKELKKRAK